MKTFYRIGLFLAVAIAIPAYAADSQGLASASNGQVITDMKARATGGGGPFDGTVDSTADLDDLVNSAWGAGWLGLHRGHRPILDVLVAFLGISHEQMHFYMEEKNLNLAGVCEVLDYDPDRLVESLTNSFMPYVDEAVSNGVIAAADAPAWREKVRAQFHRRVYWQG